MPAAADASPADREVRRMRKIIGALFFMTLGAVLATFAFGTHIVRSRSGHFVVWKTRPSLKDVYADIRVWKPEEWKNHADLAKALQEAGRGDLIPPAKPEPLRPFRGFFSRKQRQDGPH